MAIIPSESFEISPRQELIFTVGDMINDAVTSKEAMCPFDLATKIVDEVLSMQDSMTEAHTEGAPPAAAAAAGDGKHPATNHSSALDNVVWLPGSDTSAR